MSPSTTGTESLRALELTDLFKREEISGFSHSVSSIHWRNGPVYLRMDQKTLLITIKAGTDLVIDLQSGTYQLCVLVAKSHRCRSAVHG